MITYMDFVQQCFYFSTGWSWDNTYEHILDTPRNLLHFSIPSGVSLIASNRNTENNYSSLQISQLDRLQGSLSYLSTSKNLDTYYKSSHLLPLSRVVQGYRDIIDEKMDKDTREYLLYGRMYFPSQFLEGMFIKRFSSNYQLVTKFVNTPRLNKLSQPTSIFTFYLQRKTENCSNDFIFSTRENLFGFRCLYHFNIANPGSQLVNVEKKLRPSSTSSYPSTFSSGCELWYAAGSVSPGVSIAARYSTYIDSFRYLMNSIPMYSPQENAEIPSFYSTLHTDNEKKIVNSIPYAISSIHPLTFTLAANPLLGTFESTYAIKSDVHYKKKVNNSDQNNMNLSKIGIVFSSKYEFNIYSYESDLIVGTQILRSKISESSETNKVLSKGSNDGESISDFSRISPHNVVYKVSENEYTEKNKASFSRQDYMMSNIKKKPTNIEDEFISSFKISGSPTKKNIRLVWEGKFHDWFVSSGAAIDFDKIGPKVMKYGIEFSFNA